MSNPSGGSHIPVLLKILEGNTKPVLELGAGWYSTPLLYWSCKDKDILFESYETDMDWAKSLDGMTMHIERYKDAPIDKEWGIVFIDHAPSDRRIVDVERLKDKADYIVIHDSEAASEREYRYSKIYKLFEYKYIYNKHKPFTTVLSNKKPFNL